MEGITPLFDKRYKQIFGHSEAYALACYWLWRKVRDGVGGDPVRNQSKYIVHYEVWNDAQRYIKNRSGRFVDACADKEEAVLSPLETAKGTRGKWGSWKRRSTTWTPSNIVNDSVGAARQAHA